MTLAQLILLLIPLAALTVALFYFFAFVFLPGRLPFVPSKRRSVTEILSVVGDIRGKRVLDLGSGDGRIVIACAKEGAIATGFEINPTLVWWSRKKIRSAGLAERATIERADFWKKSFSDFDVVIFYGVVYAMPRLERKLQAELRIGTRVIASHCAFPTWKPLEQKGMVSVYER